MDLLPKIRLAPLGMRAEDRLKPSRQPQGELAGGSNPNTTGPANGAR